LCLATLRKSGVFISSTLIFSSHKTHEMLKLYINRQAAILLSVLLPATIFAQGVITTPRFASPAAVVTQTIGISTITVNYSRPSVKGRVV
jgi:hypothetical protein